MVTDNLAEQWNVLTQAQRKALIHAYQHSDETYRITERWQYRWKTMGAAAMRPYIDIDTDRLGSGNWYVKKAGLLLAQFALDKQLVPLDLRSVTLYWNIHPYGVATLPADSDQIERLLALGWERSNSLGENRIWVWGRYPDAKLDGVKA